MKNSLLFVIAFLLVIASSLFAQIPNPGFENWANNDPVNWSTFDFLTDGITQSSDSHSGSSAAKLEIKDFFGSALPPVLLSEHFSVSERFGSLTGYFKFTPIDANQAFSAVIVMSNGSNYIGGGAVDIYQAASSYSQFIVPIYYSTADIPDSAYIQITVLDTSGINTSGIGAFAIVDDLSLGGPTSVDNNESTINSFHLEQNYPNPFNPSTTISFSIPKEEYVSLKVFNSLGEEVAELVSETLTVGNYTTRLNASDLTSGIYFYQIKAGNFVESKKMILIK